MEIYLLFGFEEVAAHAGFEFVFGFGDDHGSKLDEGYYFWRDWLLKSSSWSRPLERWLETELL